MRILFLTDSLGLPRLHPEPVLVDETWTFKLEKLIRKNYKDKEVFFSYYCVSGLQSDQILDACEGVIGAYQADLVIVQQGIVDCYPRALKKNEVSIISRLPLFGVLVRKIIKKWYKEIILLRNISYVPLNRFGENWRSSKELLPSRSIVLPIAPACDRYKKKNPLIEKNIVEYNKMFKDIFGDCFFEDAYENVDIDSCFLSDNHHLSVSANTMLAEKIYEKIARDILKWG